MKWIILLLQITVSLILAFAGTLFFTVALAPWFDPRASLIPLLLAQNAAFMLAGALSWRWFVKEPQGRMGWTHPFPLRSFIRGCAAGVLLIGGTFLLLCVTPWMGITGVRLDGAAVRSALVAAGGFLLVAAGEEIFTRGWLQTALQRHLGPAGAVAAASLVFSGLHLSNPHTSAFAVINLFLAGVLLGTARLAGGGLWLPIGLHFSWNWTQEMLSLPVSGLHLTAAPPFSATETGPDWLTGGPFGLEGGAGALLALTAGCFWYLARLRRKRVIRRG